MLEHHREIILAIPAFLAVGFLAGWIIRSVAPDTRKLHPGLRAVLVGAALFVIAALAQATAQFGLLPSIWDSFGIGLAAYALGGAAGWWFPAAKAGRDRALFVAGAALFLLLVGLDYDTRIFGRLSKVEAGGVDLELTAPKEGEQNSVRSAITSTTAAAFPQTKGIDDALDTLYHLGSFVLKDQLYAEVLSGAQKEFRFDKELFADLDDPRRNFAIYACSRIEPLVRQLSDLQKFHRSESSALALDPRLIGLLRREYYRQVKNFGTAWNQPRDDREMAGHAKAGCDSIESTRRNTYPPADLPSAFCQAETWVEKELSVLLDLPDAKNFSRVPPTDQCVKFLTLPPAAKPSQIAEDGAYNSYLSYLAITTAAAEAAIGNNESAIHLLDNAAKAQRKAVDLSIPARLPSLMTMIRLEVAESDLMEKDQSDALVPIRLALLKQTTDDIESALLATLGGEVESLFEPYQRQRTDVKGMGDCVLFPTHAKNETKNEAQKRVQSILVYVDIFTRNNAVDVVGHKRQEIGWEDRDNTELMNWLDHSAELISTYDVSCAAQAGAVAGDLDKKQSYMLESAGAYWEAVGRNFGFALGPDVESPLSTSDDRAIDRFCRAKLAYRDALCSFKNVGDSSLCKGPLFPVLSGQGLDEQIRQSQATQYVTGLNQSLTRVNNVLAEFPAGELAKATEKHPGCDDSPLKRDATPTSAQTPAKDQ